jgi:hypothetical protein
LLLSDADGREANLLDLLIQRYREEEEKVAKGYIFLNQPPGPIQAYIEAKGYSSLNGLKVFLQGDWLVYRAQIKAVLLNGSYNASEQLYNGSYSSPWINLQESEPGEAWELIDKHSQWPTEGVSAVLLIYNGNLKESILTNTAQDKLLQA